MNKRNLGRQREDRILEAEEILREIQNQPRTIVCEFKTPVRKFGKFVKTETSLIEFGFLGDIVLKLA
jgi:hypothetical protein